MARIRSIKPETWDDEVLGRCSPLARLTFYGLISYADDEGRGRSGELFLRSRLHPHSPQVTLDLMRLALVELGNTGRVLFYEVNGEKFYWLKNFNKHQVIKKPSKSVLPPPPVPHHSRTGSPPVPHHSPTSSEPVGAGTEGNGEERSGAEAERSGSEGKGSAPSASAPVAPQAIEPGPDPEADPSLPVLGRDFTVADVAREIGLPLDPRLPPGNFAPPSDHEARRIRMKAQLEAVMTPEERAEAERLRREAQP